MNDWEKVFAWWPVELSVMNEGGFWIATGEYAWLSWVERSRISPLDGDSDFVYRIPEYKA